MKGRDRVRWRQRAAAGLLALGTLLAGCATPHFEVDDGVRFADGEARFVAFAQQKRGWILSGVEGVEVRFAAGGGEVARAKTDERGFAKAVVEIPTATDRFRATARFDGRELSHEARLFAWRRERVIVACDIDSTISDTSLGALFFDPLDLVSTPIDDSSEVLGKIQRSHHLAYVTARPRFTLDKTRTWLEHHGYPAGPVITSLTVADALAQTGYKTRTFGSLRDHYTNLLIGIGNTDIDADSYGSHGMLAILVQPEAKPSREGHVVRLRSWPQIGAFFEANADVLRDPRRLAAAARGEEELILPVEGTVGQ